MFYKNDRDGKKDQEAAWIPSGWNLLQTTPHICAWISNINTSCNYISSTELYLLLNLGCCSIYFNVFWFIIALADTVCQLETSQSHQRKRSLSWGNERANCKAFSYTVMGEGMAQPMVDWAVPGLVVLDSIMRQAEQVSGTKPVSSILPWPLYQLLLPGSILAWAVLTSTNEELLSGTIRQINPFFLNLLSVSSQQ